MNATDPAIIDDRTEQEIAADLYREVWLFCDALPALDTDAAARIAQTASDLLEIELTRKAAR